MDVRYLSSGRRSGSEDRRGQDPAEGAPPSGGCLHRTSDPLECSEHLGPFGEPHPQLSSASPECVPPDRVWYPPPREPKQSLCRCHCWHLLQALSDSSN